MSLALALLVSTATAGAAAPSPATVRLHLADCIAQRDLVMDLVGIELGFGRVVEEGADLDLHSACEASLLRLYITRPRRWRGASVLDVTERRIALTDVQASGGPRLVALNIAELVQDMPAPAPARLEAAPPAPPPDVGPRLRLGAAPTVRYVPAPDRPVPGARLSVGLDGGPDGALPWSVAIDAGFERIVRGLDVGSLRTEVASFSARAGARWAVTERLAVFTHVGLRGGWVWLAGESEDDGVRTTAGSGPWFGPMGAVFARYGDRLGVGLGLEGGWTAAGVFGDAAGTRVGLEGGWLGGELRLDWRFGGA